jgi:hypothetical protein
MSTLLLITGLKPGMRFWGKDGFSGARWVRWSSRLAVVDTEHLKPDSQPHHRDIPRVLLTTEAIQFLNAPALTCQSVACLSIIFPSVWSAG